MTARLSLRSDKHAVRTRALCAVVCGAAELRLEGLVALGVRHLSLGPPLGDDPLRAIALIGRAVIPHFR